MIAHIILKEKMKNKFLLSILILTNFLIFAFYILVNYMLYVPFGENIYYAYFKTILIGIFISIVISLFYIKYTKYNIKKNFKIKILITLALIHIIFFIVVYIYRLTSSTWMAECTTHI